MNDRADVRVGVNLSSACTPAERFRFPELRCFRCPHKTPRGAILAGAARADGAGNPYPLYPRRENRADRMPGRAVSRRQFYTRGVLSSA
jgi:hypothetical protein